MNLIPTYNVNDLTGNLDVMLQNVMQVGFTTTVILLTVWMITSLIIWLFRSQKEIRKSNQIWNKEFYNNLNIASNCTNNANII